MVSNSTSLSILRLEHSCGQDLAAEIKKHVRALDGWCGIGFGDNAELMGAWRSARNRSLRSGQAVLGPFTTKIESEGGGRKTPKGRDGSC